MTTTKDVRMTGDHARAFQEATVDEAKEILGEFTKQELADMSKKVNKVRDEFYPRSRGVNKRSNVREWFYDDELERILSVIRNPAIKRVFQLMFFYCLRVSEVAHCEWLRGQNGGLLKVHQPKNNREEFLPVHGRTTEILEDYEEFCDYSTGYLQVCMAAIREDAAITEGQGLDNVVAESEDGRDLHQFGTHSFRRTSATVFGREVGADSLKVKKWLRHSTSGDDSLRYYGYGEREWRRDLELAFGPYYDLI